MASSFNDPDVEITQHISSNHMDMCRFQGPGDAEYAKFINALNRVNGPRMSVCASNRSTQRYSLPKRMVTSVLRYDHPTSNGPVPGVGTTIKIPDIRMSNEELQDIFLRWLKFDRAYVETLRMKSTSASHCNWLLDHHHFQDWLTLPQPLILRKHMWLRGRPGSGKSTIAAFVYTHLAVTRPLEMSLFFSFASSRSSLRQLKVEFYRSLLAQVFHKAPHILPAFRKSAEDVESGDFKWEACSLRDLWIKAMVQLQDCPVSLVVDASGNCSNGEIRSIIHVLKGQGEWAVSEKKPFRVFFISSYYETCCKDHFLCMNLEDQEGHNRGIASYTHFALESSTGEKIDEAERELMRQSAGNYSWTILTINYLNGELASPRDSLLVRLKELPSDIPGVIDLILKQKHDSSFSLSLQWLLYSKSPMTCRSLNAAIHSGIPGKSTDSWIQQDFHPEEICTFFSKVSKGLIVEGDDGNVRLVHDHVRDVLLKKNGLARILRESDDGDLIDVAGVSHDWLKQCCLNYLTYHFSDINHIVAVSNVAQGMTEGDTVTRSRKKSHLRPRGDDEEKRLANDEVMQSKSVAGIGEKRPFFTYAVRYVLQHAEAAQSSNISQRGFLDDFPLEQWKLCYNSIEKYRERHIQTSNMVKILSDLGLFNLVKEKLQLDGYITELANGSECALATIKETKNPILARWFIGEIIKGNPERDAQQNEPERLEQDVTKVIASAFYQTYESGHVASLVAESGDEQLQSLILKSKMVNPNVLDARGLSPLISAVLIRSPHAVKMLLQRDDIDVKQENRPQRARMKGLKRSDVPKPVSKASKKQLSPLRHAMAIGAMDMLKLLLLDRRIVAQDDIRAFMRDEWLRNRSKGAFRAVTDLESWYPDRKPRPQRPNRVAGPNII